MTSAARTVGVVCAGPGLSRIHSRSAIVGTPPSEIRSLKRRLAARARLTSYGFRSLKRRLAARARLTSLRISIIEASARRPSAAHLLRPPVIQQQVDDDAGHGDVEPDR